MQIIFSAKNFPVSQKLYARIERKIDKLSRYFNPSVEAQVRLSSESGNRRICEITIPFEGGVLRAEECSDDMYQSVDRVLVKIERQIHRHRTKLEKRLRDDAFQPEYPEYFEQLPPDEEAHKLVRTKSYPAKPMNVEDAIVQMEMLGHSFFVFVNGETQATCVVYQRKDGDYGLLEPEV